MDRWPFRPVLYLLLMVAAWPAAAASVRIHRAEELALAAKALPTASELAKTSGTARPPTSFDAFGKRFALELESNDDLIARLPAARRQQIAEHSQFLAGRIAGQPFSWLRLARIGDELYGVIFDGHELYSIAPASTIATLLDPGVQVDNPRATLIYRASDMEIDLGERFCAAVHSDDAASPQSGLEVYRAISAELAASAASAPLPTRELEVGLLGDFEFSQRQGVDSEEAMLARFNIVDGIFSTQANLRITPALVHVFTTSNDPFTKVTSEDVLTELGNYRSTHPELTALGLTHLLTARSFEDRVIGIGYIAGVCKESAGVSVSSDMGFDVYMSALVAAHELGHNLGADHDGERGSPCAATPDGFLMEPTINGSSTFSACSLTTMKPVIAAAACIFPARTHDLELVVDATSLPLTVRQPVDLHYELRSRGSMAVDDVVLTIDINNAALSIIDSVTVDGGQCVSGFTQITCELGSVSADETRHVTLALRGENVGDATLVARLTATNDDVEENNLAVTSLSFGPRVNVTLSTDVQERTAYLGDPLTSRFRVAAVGVEPAQNVVLSVSMSPLTVRSASSAVGPCAIMPFGVECNLGTVTTAAPREVVITYVSSYTGHHDLLGDATALHDDIRGDERSGVGVNILPNKALAVNADADHITVEPGELVDVGFTISSVGRYAIAEAVARVSGGLDVVSVDVGGSACTPPATPGAWTCVLGTLEAGATRHIHAVVRAGDVGGFTVRTLASSPEDDNLTTPLADTNVTVEYAFDMQVETPDEAVGYDHREFEVNLIVGALGTEASTNVVARIALPDDVAAVAADPSFGTCTIVTGSVECNFGTVEPLHRVVIQLRLRSIVTGQFYGTVTVFSDNDRVAVNDQLTLSLLIEPAIDIAVLTPEDVEAIIGTPFAFSFTIQASTQPIPSTSVSISSSAAEGGVTIDSATTDQGSCQSTGHSAICAMDALSAGGSASITVQAHSDVETSDSFFILATAPGDIDDSNDREILAIQVQPEPPPPPPPPDPGDSSSGSGGGGRIDPTWLLLALSLLATAAHRRSLRTRSRR